MNPEKLTKPAAGQQYADGVGAPVEDALVVEAPLHIKVNGEAFTTTMRTPGDDRALTRGLLYTEGIVTDPNAALSFREIADPESGLAACVEVTLDARDIEKEVDGRRSLLSGSSCGVCGTRDPADIAVYGPPLDTGAAHKLEVALIPVLLDRMKAKQVAFDESGGSHAAAIYDESGEVLAVREDIGRHNAVDKAVGSLLEAGRLADGRILFVSGRLSYEIIYKAYRAAIPFVLAVSAPSSMAVETAERLGMSVVAFCRDGRATVYSCGENVVTKGVEASP